MQLGIMIEGQDGLNWGRWQKLVKAADELGFEGIYRSDHFVPPKPPDGDSLELWVSLVWAAGYTQHIRLGSLVTPFSFRDPIHSTRMALQINDLAEGRFVFGVGAGWQEREHTMFGYPLLDLKSRFDRFAEGLAVAHHFIHNDESLTYHGEYQHLQEAVLLPRPQHDLPLLIGGKGRKRTMPLVAKYADIWNSLRLPSDEYGDLNRYLDELLEKEGRAKDAVTRSLFTEIMYGADQKDLEATLQRKGVADKSPDDLLAVGRLVGTSSQVVDQLGILAENGLELMITRWTEFDDLEKLASFAESVLPQIKTL